MLILIIGERLPNICIWDTVVLVLKSGGRKEGKRKAVKGPLDKKAVQTSMIDVLLKVGLRSGDSLR